MLLLGFKVVELVGLKGFFCVFIFLVAVGGLVGAIVFFIIVIILLYNLSQYETLPQRTHSQYLFRHSDEDRKCTDIVFLVLFIALSVIIFGFAIYGWAAGHLHDLKTPYDPDGKACGKDFPDHRFIYFASPHHDSLNVTTCVKSCPKEGDTELDCQVNSMVQTCQATNNANNLKAVEIYDSDDALNSFCHPTSDVIYE